MTRYSINAVYRRDNPSITKGRFREFYQCDFDIAGKFEPIEPDSRCLKVLCEVLNELDLKSFIIKVNHRLLLNGMFAVAGVPEEKFKTICSSIDKLGKLTWEEIKQEMCKDKGLAESVADQIGEMIKYHGSIEMLNELLSSDLGKNVNAKKGLEELKILYNLCKNSGIEGKIEFDLSLARGLDYYTGVIYEAVLQDDGLEVGSIAAGGRYDGLVGLLSADKHDVPCVGVSVGIERILAIIEKRFSVEPSMEVECFVISIGKGMVEERLKIIRELDDAQISVDHLDKANPKLLPQIQAAEEKNIPYIVMLGENELKDGIVKIRDVKTRAETPIERAKLVEELKKMLIEKKSDLTGDSSKGESNKITSTNDAIDKIMGGDAIDDEKSNQLLGLYTPKGMQDYDPERMLDREEIFNTIENTFKRSGAQPLDTPICELKETLQGKYGPEEEKLIFHLADQGGEILSLRYDLTVPFARFLTMFKMHSMKRYHIGKVYRIDNPDCTKGTFREFYQCDFDIAGQSDSMIADSRCIRVLYKCLKDAGLQSFIIKVNMVPILEGVFTLAGAPEKSFKTLFIAMDKLKKTSWDEIKQNLLKETGLTEVIVDKIRDLIQHRGSEDKLDELLAGELGKIKSSQEALESLKTLFKYCQALGIDKDSIEFDLSLSRGLDYYTGLIFEASLKDPVDHGFGSVAGGGRYDGLVTLLAGKKHKVPAVGFSIGSDRLLTIKDFQKSIQVKE
uniref:histidine--tRNA ligase n=2 Tax=Tetranychus urticae TaxID=32264 RepID=T1K9N3_TETUR